MKKVIRTSVFETNSSSEHSLSIVKKSNFVQWKNGEQYARRMPGYTSYDKTWGNFWSEQHYWQFNHFTEEELIEQNNIILKDFIDDQIKETEKWLENSTENGKKYAQDRLDRLRAMTYEMLRPVEKLYDHLWITYKEYIEALHEDDCASPFEHVNDTEDVVVFGKYFHS